MFCPNCGTENDDSATTCKKCGFNLKGAAAPKFKGTMLMMNAGAPAPRPGAPGPAQPAPGAPPAAAPGPHMPPTGPGMPTGPRAQLKGTMLGVAPPSLGAQAPPPGAVPAPAPAPAPAGFGQPPPAAAPPGFPGGGVNPLGGTMVADQAGGFNPYGQGPGAYGAPPQGGGFGAPPAAPGNYGGAPPAPAGFGAPPAPAGFGPPPGAPPGGGFPPPGGGGFGQPPQQGFGQPPGGGPPPAYGQPPGGGYGAPAAFGAPAAAPGYAPGAAVVPAGGRGAIGKTRNPVMTLLISMLCFVYAIIEAVAMLKELMAFRGKQDINILIHLLLWPIMVWGLPAKVLEAKQMAGVPNAQVASPVLYFLLSLYFLPNDLNEVWQAAGGGQQR